MTWNKTYTNQNKASLGILISDKTDIRTRTNTRI